MLPAGVFARIVVMNIKIAAKNHKHKNHSGNHKNKKKPLWKIINVPLFKHTNYAFFFFKKNWYKNKTNTLWAFQKACFGWTLLNQIDFKHIELRNLNWTIQVSVHKFKIASTMICLRYHSLRIRSFCFQPTLFQHI